MKKIILIAFLLWPLIATVPIVFSACAANIPDYGIEIEILNLDQVKLEAKIASLQAEIDSLWYYSDTQGFLIEAIFGELELLQLPDGGTYEVKLGDTLWGIAEKELGAGYRWVEIYVLNYWSIEHQDWIFPNQILKVGD